MTADIRAATRRRTRVVTETRCVVCGTWFVARRGATTDRATCRSRLKRARDRGERPPYAPASEADADGNR